MDLIIMRLLPAVRQLSTLQWHYGVRSSMDLICAAAGPSAVNSVRSSGTTGSVDLIYAATARCPPTVNLAVALWNTEWYGHCSFAAAAGRQQQSTLYGVVALRGDGPYLYSRCRLSANCQPCGGTTEYRVVWTLFARLLPVVSNCQLCTE